ncbi:MAG TPA: hypothetical protein VGF44_00810 [Terriglobales bacterium]|jgi:hypothetical protein
MKSTRKSLLFVATLALAIAVCTAVPAAQAADMRGTLTLPMEANWNGTVLPAGNYEYSLQYNGPATLVMVRNTATMKGALFLASAVTDASATSKPQLTLTREESGMAVTALSVGDMSLAFGATSPKAITHAETTAAMK